MAVFTQEQEAAVRDFVVANPRPPRLPIDKTSETHDFLVAVCDLWALNFARCQDFVVQMMAFVLQRRGEVKSLQEQSTVYPLRTWQHDTVYENPLETGLITMLQPVNEAYDYDKRANEGEPPCNKDYVGPKKNRRLGRCSQDHRRSGGGEGRGRG
jgi:hypothetical protein